YEQNAGVWKDLDRIGFTSWAGVLGYFVLSDNDTARLTADADLNTDDRLPLEFSAPPTLYLDTVEPNLRMVEGVRTRGGPEVPPESEASLDQPGVAFAVGRGYANRGRWNLALPHLERALQLDPENRQAAVWTALGNVRLRRPQVGLQLAEQV